LANVRTLIAFLEALYEEPTGVASDGVHPDYGVMPHFSPIGLTHSIDLSGAARNAAGGLFSRLAALIERAYGVAGLKISASHALRSNIDGQAGLFVHRMVASGGGRYPADLSLWIPAWASNCGSAWRGRAFAYAPHYARLFELPLAASESISRTEFPVEDDAVVLAISLDFYRTYPKYREFTYRLSAVDTGLLLGRITRLAGPEWTVKIDFDLNAELQQRILGRDTDRYPIYALITLRFRGPTSRHDEIWPRLEEHAPIGMLDATAPLPAPQSYFSGHFLHAHRMAQGAPTNTTHGTGSATMAVGPRSEEFGDPDESSHGIFRQSRAHAFTGLSLDRHILERCVKAMMHARAAMIGAASGQATASPPLLITVLNVDGVERGLYAVNEGSDELQRIAALDQPEKLSVAQYGKTFDIQKAGFVVHVTGHVECLLKGARGVREFRVREMVNGATLEAGIAVCAARDVTAHPYLGFSSRRVKDFYRLNDSKLRVMSQLCVGRVSDSAYLYYPFQC
jgi:hypothetical protein